MTTARTAVGDGANMRLIEKVVASRKQPAIGYTDRAGFVFILGMHRSGTSCLAGSLERCGLFLGDVVRQSPHNARGNHELREVQRVHNQILHASGGSWRQPPARIRANWRQKRTLGSIATRLAQHAPCGLKDPRLLLLLDVWAEIVDPHTLVGTFRHPAAVARSLARRNQMPEAETYDLWLTYNAALIRWHKLYRFPIVEFDLANAEAYCQAVAATASAIGLTPDVARLREFVSPALDHASAPDQSVSAICREAYAYLRHHRVRPPDPD